MTIATGVYQEGSGQDGPGSVAGVGSQGLEAAGLAGNPQEGELQPSVKGAVGAAPYLEPQAGELQRQEFWGQGAGQPGARLQLGVGNLQQPNLDAPAALQLAVEE